MLFWKKKLDQSNTIPAQPVSEAVLTAPTTSVATTPVQSELTAPSPAGTDVAPAEAAAQSSPSLMPPALPKPDKSFWAHFRLLIMVGGILLIAVAVWFIFFRSTNETTTSTESEIIVEEPSTYVSESIILAVDGHTKAEVSAYTKEIGYGIDLPIYAKGDEIVLSDKKNRYAKTGGLPFPKAKILVGIVGTDQFEAKQSAIEETLTMSTDKITFKPYKNTSVKAGQVTGLRLEKTKTETIFTKSAEANDIYYFIDSDKSSVDANMAKAGFTVAQIEQVNKLFATVQDQSQTLTFGSCIDFGSLGTDLRAQYCFETNLNLGIAIQVDIIAHLERP